MQHCPRLAEVGQEGSEPGRKRRDGLKKEGDKFLHAARSQNSDQRGQRHRNRGRRDLRPCRLVPPSPPRCQ